jgi:hypothetical protein
MKRYAVFFLMVGLSGAKVDLVTLPASESVQITIYESADLTLVRDSRPLTLRQGTNQLQFSWAGTLIDPTSLMLVPKKSADQVDITDLSYPPNAPNVGIWTLESRQAGSVPFEITYLTSGFRWRAFYAGILSEDEKTMRLEGYVRLFNQSGEDYDNAQVRLIVGQVHLLDEIAELARRTWPYGRPGEGVPPMPAAVRMERARLAFDAVKGMEDIIQTAEAKEIRKEGLSEYFLYTIEGTESIPNGWSKRLPSFQADAVPVVNLYKFEEEMFGPAVIRYLYFFNDAEHHLGQTPIPGGQMKVYRTVSKQGHLTYEGGSEFKYIPVGQEVELNLGPTREVLVTPKLMDFKTDNYRFDDRGNVSGWDEIRRFVLEVKNSRPLPVRLEIKRNFNTPYWSIEHRDGSEKFFEKVDVDTVKYTLDLPPQSSRTIEYILTSYHGVRQEDWSRQNR